MAGHLANGALYTVEQIELIRRLRNSGISKDQLVNAYETFERLDQELGPMYYMPNPMLAHNLMSQAQAQFAVQMQMVSQASQLAAQQQQQQQNLHTQDTPKKTPQLLHSNNAVEDLAPLPSHITPQELEEKLKEFIAKGDQSCCEEIRDFVQKNQIRQQQVAVLAGISQPYVSRFLKGDFRDMSARSRHAIHRWYLIYKDSPELTGFTPRRERFVFRPRHVEILERHFEEDSYPTQERKEEIANECNNALESAGNTFTGRMLSEKERVSPQVVGTWFANKRKDLKKIAREEGLDGELAWRPRGRPRQWGSDSSMPSMTPPSSNTIMLDNNTAMVLDPEADEQSVARAVEEAAVNHAITSIASNWVKKESSGNGVYTSNGQPELMKNGHDNTSDMQMDEDSAEKMKRAVQEAVASQNGLAKLSSSNGVTSITGNWVKAETKTTQGQVMAAS